MNKGPIREGPSVNFLGFNNPESPMTGVAPNKICATIKRLLVTFQNLKELPLMSHEYTCQSDSTVLTTANIGDVCNLPR